MTQPPPHCPQCGHEFTPELRRTFAGQPTPQPTRGAISICFPCGAINVYVDAHTLRTPTVPELDRILQSPSVQYAITTARRAREGA